MHNMHYVIYAQVRTGTGVMDPRTGRPSLGRSDFETRVQYVFLEPDPEPGKSSYLFRYQSSLSNAARWQMHRGHAVGLLDEIRSRTRTLNVHNSLAVTQLDRPIVVGLDNETYKSLVTSGARAPWAVLNQVKKVSVPLGGYAI